MSRLPLKLALTAAVLATSGIVPVAEIPSASAFTLHDSGRVEIDASKDNTGSTFKLAFDGNADSKNVAGLSSEATFKFLGLTNLGNKSEASFEITLENTSSNGIFSRTSALGFNLTDLQGNKLDLLGVGNPGGSGNTRSTGLFANDRSGEFPNQFGAVDVCFSDASSCQEDSNGGVDNDPQTRLAQKSKFTTTLAFDGSVTQFALSNFGIRYQSINGESYVDASGTGRFKYIQPSNQKAIPEPSTLSGLLLIGIGIFHQSRKRQPAAS